MLIAVIIKIIMTQIRADGGIQYIARSY